LTDFLKGAEYFIKNQSETRGGIIIKQSIVSILAIICALVSFYLLRIGIFEFKLFYLPFGLLIFLVVWGISSFLIERTTLILLTGVVVAAGFLFIWGFSTPYLICATFMLFSLFWGFKKVSDEKKFRIKILMKEIVPKGVGWLFFALATIMAVGFCFSPKVQDLKKGIKLPTRISEWILATVTPGFNKEMTVDETLNLMLKREKNAPLPRETREDALKQLGLFDLKLSGKEKISQRPEILDRLVSDRVNQLIKGFGDYIPIIIAVIIFQIALWLNKVLIPLVSLLDSVIYLILRSTNLIQIAKIKVDKEVLKI